MNRAPFPIKYVTMAPRSSYENKISSSALINNNQLYDLNKNYATGGVLDLQMGSVNRDIDCVTCGLTSSSGCPGHTGNIQLNYPIISPLFKNRIKLWLQSACLYCGNLYIKDKQKKYTLSSLSKKIKNNKSYENCASCKKPFHQIKVAKEGNGTFYYNDEKTKEYIVISNLELYEFVNKITNESLNTLSEPLKSHPKNMVLNNMVVPPITLRPQKLIQNGNMNNIDNADQTAYYVKVIDLNNKIVNVTDISKKNEFGELLQILYNQMISGSTKKNLMNNRSKKKPIESLMKQFPQKSGVFRNNLLGKRFRVCVRSVVTNGGVRLKINEGGIPLVLAKKIPIPEKVTAYNYNKLVKIYNNGNKYPGFISIKKGSNGRTIHQGYLKGYSLNIGDTVNRHLMDGDPVIFNRQPSLLLSNIMSHKAVIIKGIKSLVLNSSSCVGYNADFDGDEMGGFIPQGIQAQNEIDLLSSTDQYMISHLSYKCIFGIIQDGISGLAKLTHEGVTLDKCHAMRLLGGIVLEKEFPLDKKIFTGKEIISLVLPDINVTIKSRKYSNIYVKSKNKSDELCVIENGIMKSGILDAATIGEKSNSSIFYIVYKKYGSAKAQELIYTLQLIAMRYLQYSGFTIGYKDVIVDKSLGEKIDKIQHKSIVKISETLEKLDRGQLQKPAHYEMKHFVEDVVISEMDHSEDVSAAIIENLNESKEGNRLLDIVNTGAKAKLANVVTIKGNLGSQIISNQRLKSNLSVERTSPYSTRFNLDPINKGWIGGSYSRGIDSIGYIATAMESRSGVVQIALSTSSSGHRNRINVKNLESIYTDHLRHCVKKNYLVQPLYHDTGMDTRSLSKVKIDTIMISDNEFEKYKITLNNGRIKEYLNTVDGKNKTQIKENLEYELSKEFKQLTFDRNKTRDIFLKIEKWNAKNQFDNKHDMPINVTNIIKDCYQINKTAKELKSTRLKNNFDPIEMLQDIEKTMDDMVYIFMNNEQKVQGARKPKYLEKSLSLLKVYIRSCLNMKTIIDYDLNNDNIRYILEQINISLSRSLIDYGTAAGIISAQCISEPITQYMLNSKHRSGAGSSTSTDELEGINRIFGAGVKYTDKKKVINKLERSSMTIYPKPKYSDKVNANILASMIRYIKLDEYISGSQIFYERFGEPIHPDYKHEKKDIFNYINMTKSNIHVDLSHWCIRFSINKLNVLTNGTTMQDIVLSLKEKWGSDYEFVFTDEISDNVFIRCYPIASVATVKTRNTSMIKYNYNKKNLIIKLMNKLVNTKISGIDHIKNATVKQIFQSYIDDHGEIKRKKINIIETVGTNTSKVINHFMVDNNLTQTNNIEEFESIYGIEATRNKIISELRKEMDIFKKEHLTIFADEMTILGTVTNVTSNGIQKRNHSDFSSKVVFQNQNKTITESAAKSIGDVVDKFAGAAITGSIAKMGTLFSKISINQEFVNEHYNSEEDNNNEIFDDESDDELF